MQNLTKHFLFKFNVMHYDFLHQPFDTISNVRPIQVPYHGLSELNDAQFSAHAKPKVRDNFLDKAINLWHYILNLEVAGANPVQSTTELRVGSLVGKRPFECENPATNVAGFFLCAVSRSRSSLRSRSPGAPHPPPNRSLAASAKLAEVCPEPTRTHSAAAA
jgi:hypothetical protein